jgi:hypothetical protein
MLYDTDGGYRYRRLYVLPVYGNIFYSLSSLLLLVDYNADSTAGAQVSEDCFSELK